MKWAVLVPHSERQPILNKLHSDWIWPLSLIPRSVSSWISDAMPRKIAGNSVGHLDIPDSGWLIASPPYFAFTCWGWHGRIGLRRDMVDGYYAASVTLKRWRKA